MAPDAGPDGRPVRERASPAGSGPRPLADILQAIGREVAELGRLASQLQTELSPLGPASGQGRRVPAGLQALDLMTQRLHATADFLGALAPGLPAGWVCDAAAASRVVALSDLAHRLGHPGSDPAPAGSGAAGELDLFEADGRG